MGIAGERKCAVARHPQGQSAFGFGFQEPPVLGVAEQIGTNRGGGHDGGEQLEKHAVSATFECLVRARAAATGFFKKCKHSFVGDGLVQD